MLSFFVYSDYYRIQQSFIANTLDVCKMGDAKARALFEASRPHTLAHRVAAGIGVTLIARLALDARITQGTDNSLSRLETPASRQIGLAWRQTSSRAEEFRVLAGTLREPSDVA